MYNVYIQLYIIHSLFTATFLQALSGTEKIILCLMVLTALVLLFWLLSYLYSVMCRRDYAKWRKSAGRYGLANRLVSFITTDADHQLMVVGKRSLLNCFIGFFWHAFIHNAKKRETGGCGC